LVVVGEILVDRGTQVVLTRSTSLLRHSLLMDGRSARVSVDGPGEAQSIPLTQVVDFAAYPPEHPGVV
jgi:hypothetical protein